MMYVLLCGDVARALPVQVYLFTIWWLYLVIRGSAGNSFLFDQGPTFCVSSVLLARASTLAVSVLGVISIVPSIGISTCIVALTINYIAICMVTIIIIISFRELVDVPSSSSSNHFGCQMAHTYRIWTRTLRRS